MKARTTINLKRDLIGSLSKLISSNGSGHFGILLICRKQAKKHLMLAIFGRVVRVCHGIEVGVASLVGFPDEFWMQFKPPIQTKQKGQNLLDYDAEELIRETSGTIHE
jgi:hypothetical protein